MIVKVAFDTVANYSSSLEKTFDIGVEVPFTSQFYFFTQQFQPIAPLSGAIVINHPFFFCIDVLSTTSFPLQFIQSSLFLVLTIFFILIYKNSKSTEGPIAQSDGSTNILKDKSYILQKENKITIWYQVIPNLHASGESVDLGFVQLEWRRYFLSAVFSLEDSLRMPRLQ